MCKAVNKKEQTDTVDGVVSSLPPLLPSRLCTCTRLRPPVSVDTDYLRNERG